ncbi:MAG: PIG-L family deacetylase [Bacteroidetes bacterium]|nr:PIG-L family deacetylase [Bacteroidota bacterium]
MTASLPGKILILAPHTDDGEFGCGGSVTKWLEEGYEITYVAFSACKTTIPKDLPSDILETELMTATSLLGIKDVRIFDFEVRYFSYKRQDILEEMVKLNHEIKPRLVLTPSSADIHQDHQVVHNESIRAFKYSNLLGYELPWNNMVMSTSCFSTLTEDQIKKKIDSILTYKSQHFRHYYSEEFIRSLAYTRGTQIGTHYAEAFEVLRWII